MPKTVKIWGSDGEVMVHMGGGGFCRARPEMVRVTKVPPTESNLLSVVKKALVGLEFRAIWSKEYLNSHGQDKLAKIIPDGGSLAFVEEMIEALKESGKKGAAGSLRKQASNDGDMLILYPRTYETVC